MEAVLLDLGMGEESLAGLRAVTAGVHDTDDCRQISLQK